jgi:hypothetical protein
MTAVDLTWLFYTKRCEKISLIAAANGAATINGSSRRNPGNLRCVGCWWGLGGGVEERIPTALHLDEITPMHPP